MEKLWATVAQNEQGPGYMHFSPKRKKKATQR